MLQTSFATLLDWSRVQANRKVMPAFISAADMTGDDERGVLTKMSILEEEPIALCRSLCLTVESKESFAAKKNANR